MFKALGIFLPTVFASPSALAAAISDVDIGTYALAGKNNRPSDMHIRLSIANGKWVMEGKQGGARWKNCGCDDGCDYRASSPAEVATYLSAFPASMQRIDSILRAFRIWQMRFAGLLTKTPPQKADMRLSRSYQVNRTLDSKTRYEAISLEVCGRGRPKARRALTVFAVCRMADKTLRRWRRRVAAGKSSRPAALWPRSGVKLPEIAVPGNRCVSAWTRDPWAMALPTGPG